MNESHTSPTLRDQFPLSSKKFWKKIIEKSIVFLFLAALLSVIASVVKVSLSGNGSGDISFANFVGDFVVYGALSFALFTGIYATYVNYYIKLYFYSDDQDFLTIKKGVFAPTEIHVQYLKIQDVYVDQDILDRIMGLYDVHISSATYSSGMEAHIDGVEKAAADGLKHLMLSKIKGSTTAHHANQASHTDTMQSKIEQESKPVASLSTHISSEKYGLSSDWWLSEYTKLALSSITLPLFISTWAILAIFENNADWNKAFWIWFAALLLTVGYRLIYLFLWKSHYKYEFGEEYIYMKVGVLSVSEKNMAYKSIQDVKVNQSFIDRLFGVADLIIENASSGGGNSLLAQYAAAKKGVVPENGIVIEGLSLVDANTISAEIKNIILKKGGLSNGL